MLIFNEDKQYEYLIKYGFSKFINVRDLGILSRHFYKEGLSKEEIKSNLIKYCYKWDEDFNEVKYAKKIDTALNLANSDGIIKNIIHFSQGELNFILDKDLVLQEQKMLFIICCLAKWQKHNYIYLNTDSIIQPMEIKEIFKTLSNTNCVYELLYQLKLKNKIKINLKPIMRVDILFNFCENEDKAILSFEPSMELAEHFYMIKNNTNKCVKLKK